jgi:CRP/FNR family cyclic AMP-dependent transcriptional regulator
MATMTEYRLDQVPLFAALQPAICLDLEAQTTVRHLPRGTVLAVEGELAEKLFVVHAGRVAAFHHAESGRQAHIRTDEAPVVVDKATVIAGSRQLFTWTALSDTVVRYLPRQTFLHLFNTEASVSLQTAMHLATQANLARDDYLKAATDSSRRRVLQRLRLLADDSGTARLPDGQAGLADELGLTRVTVSRTLRQLADSGLITLAGRAIQLDPSV